MDVYQRERLLADPEALASHIADVLFEQTTRAREELARYADGWGASSVLFLIQDPERGQDGPRLILNKRSQAVPQPGDLCCPGGGVDQRMDPWIARFSQLPVMPMGLWPYRRVLGLGDPDRRIASLLLATALREAFEEMRLCPVGVTFLGLLPAQRLRLLKRAIHPVVARLDRHPTFRPNREVEAVVAIPLRDLIQSERYGRLQVRFENNPEANERVKEDLLCYIHETGTGSEMLWGATLRVTTVFLERVFGFRPPDLVSLPLHRVTLGPTYATGNGR